MSKRIAAVPARARGDSALRLRALADTVDDRGVVALRRLTVRIAVADALIAVVSFSAAHLVRFGTSPPTWHYVAVTLAAPVAWLTIFASMRLYGGHRFAPEEEFRRTAVAVALATATVTMASYWMHASLSRIWIALAAVLSLTLALASRAWWRRRLRRMQEAGTVSLRTIIVGTNREAVDLVGELAGSGYEPVAYVETQSATRRPGDLPIAGSLSDLSAIVAELRAACILVAASDVAPADMGSIAAIARRAGVELRVTSRLPEIITTRLTVQRLGRVHAVAVMPPRLTAVQRLLKRLFDVVVASLLLIVFAPVMAVIAVAVRATSPGPALFRQQRVTRGGRTFAMLKFRTMRADAPAPEGIAQPFFKPVADPRITRLGRLLRRFSLDELPQLLNVIRGDMSLVGPRPLPREQVEGNTAALAGRHDVPAGMTGWWQIRGRSDTDAAEAVRLDLFYVENWSLLYDLYILACTLGAVLRGKGAR